MTAADYSASLGALGVLVAAVLWGTTGTAATFAPGVGPLAIGAAAMGIGGLLQAAVAMGSLCRQRARLVAQRRYLILGGVAVALYPLAFYSAMDMAGVAIGTVITIGAAPLFSAVIEWRLEGLALTRRWTMGALLGLAGMGLLCLPAPEALVARETSQILAGVAVGLVAGLTYALYSWSARHVMQAGVSSAAAMGATFGLGGLLLLPLLLVTGAPFLASWPNFAVGAYMALVPMFIGYVCFGLGLARVRASLATTITLIEPVVAALLAIIVVGETLSALGWLGIALIIASLMVITLPWPARRAARPQSAA